MGRGKHEDRYLTSCITSDSKMAFFRQKKKSKICLDTCLDNNSLLSWRSTNCLGSLKCCQHPQKRHLKGFVHESEGKLVSFIHTMITTLWKGIVGRGDHADSGDWWCITIRCSLVSSGKRPFMMILEEGFQSSEQVEWHSLYCQTKAWVHFNPEVPVW